MKNVIDLSPYLPQPSAVSRPRRRRFGSIVAFFETLVTLCIGAGFLIALAAFLSVI